LTNTSYFDKFVHARKQAQITGETIMKYHLLGKSGLRVSELALGAMSFGTEWGWGTEKNEARRMLD
jgi:hypothetical protein